MSDTQGGPRSSAFQRHTVSNSSGLKEYSMGVKLFGLIPRRADLTVEQFHDYYRHPHATFGLELTILRGYVQSHQIYTDKLGSDQNRFDAVAEIWLDSQRDAEGFRDDPILAKHILTDEPKFVAMDKLDFFVATEEVIASGPRQDASLSIADAMWSPRNRPISVKLLHFVARDGNAGWAGDNDANLGHQMGALRHVRCHPLKGFPGPPPSFLGLHELWWPTRQAFHAGVAAAPDAFGKLIAQAGGSTTLLVQAERFF
jgi:uncharacterized protein (TIGR02118 family)